MKILHQMKSYTHTHIDVSPSNLYGFIRIHIECQLLKYQTNLYTLFLHVEELQILQFIFWYDIFFLSNNFMCMRQTHKYRWRITNVALKNERTERNGTYWNGVTCSFWKAMWHVTLAIWYPISVDSTKFAINCLLIRSASEKANKNVVIINEF